MILLIRLFSPHHAHADHVFPLADLFVVETEVGFVFPSGARANGEPYGGAQIIGHGFNGQETERVVAAIGMGFQGGRAWQ